MSYEVKLDVFEGPLDLLLFFISRDEIDIYDIPIAYITDSYLEYLDLMRELNISIAGEYIRMAATLMRVKARTLLPQLAGDPDDEDYEDPRSELVEMLLEYKRFKELAGTLKVRESDQRQHFQRKPDLSYVDTDVRPDEVLNDVTLYELMKTFKRLLDNIPETPTHNIERVQTNIRKQSEYLRNRLQKDGKVMFSAIMKELDNKITIIVTFIALLDMIKNQEVAIFQETIFEDFRIERRMETAKA
ncbi:MAG: segregation/condensation protein A [Candidatus Marinimicrobia bacterium]|nr:segregation/condensation protein A [Candidatus Neomarinimicrobiota bacterium]MCF7828575.1 segregation/condensation protein A [Candidatus Neomarinimicrobiota bacterium]MCF7880316.1 segregation/condensation protein A [Candidatus Neomarinimicrobiota bacterium]